MKDEKMKHGSNKAQKVIKNNMNDIRNVEKVTAKEKLKIRCQCQHTDESGKTMMFASHEKKSPYTGAPLFVCRLCGQYVDISEITEEELDKSIDTIARAAEIIKIRLRPERSDEDKKAYKRDVKVLYMMRSGQFMDLFKAARKRTKGNNRSNRDSGFISGNPRSSR